MSEPYSGLTYPLLTTWPALTEAMYLLGQRGMESPADTLAIAAPGRC